MSRTPTPIHGRDHRPDGADPINAIFYDYANDGGYLEVTTENHLTFVNNGSDGGTTMTDNGSAGISLTSNSQFSITNFGGSTFFGVGIFIHQGTGPVGIEITDDSSDGLYLNAGNVLHLFSIGGMQLQDSDGGIRIVSTYSPNDFNGQLGAQTAHAIQILSGDSATVGLSTIAGFDSGGNVGAVRAGQATFTGGSGLTFKGAHVIVGSGQAFSVVDQSGFRIFEARNDGTVHIKTGHAIVADL